MSKLRVLDLFSGIGGFSLGLERTGGFETVAFCEIDPFCRRVLAKHWPHVRQFEDVTKLKGEDVGPIDVICGGFPCQDISFAGKGAGLAGERSGLWREYARIIGELSPRYIIVENVAALLGRGLGDVLGDLAAIGYDAEWHCIPASAVGAPHRRDRVWIVAYPNSLLHSGGLDAGGARCAASGSESRDAGEGKASYWERVWTEPSPSNPFLADAQGERRREARQHSERSEKRPAGRSDVPNANALNAQGLKQGRNDTLIRREQVERQARLSSGAGGNHDWSVEPPVGRVAHGVPDRVGQLRAYGNAVVPQIPELIGRAILAAQEAA